MAARILRRSPVARTCAWQHSPCLWQPQRRCGTLCARSPPRSAAAAGALASAPRPQPAARRGGRRGSGRRDSSRGGKDGSAAGLSARSDRADDSLTHGAHLSGEEPAIVATTTRNRPKRARGQVSEEKAGFVFEEVAEETFHASSSASRTDKSGQAAKTNVFAIDGTGARVPAGDTRVRPSTTGRVRTERADRGPAGPSQKSRTFSMEISASHSQFSSEAARAGRDPERKRIPALTTLLQGGESEVREALAEIACGDIDMSIQEFNDVLSTLGRHRKIRVAIGLMRVSEISPFGNMISTQRNVKTFTIMIDIYGKARQLSRAFSLFYGMQREGYQPNVITYNAMVAACVRNNEPELAYEVFEEMKARGLKPDKFTYGSLIDSCAKCGDVKRAFEISALMDASGIIKDQTIYSALMDACGRAHQLDRAIQVFEEMKRKGVWPNLITFAVLIDTCANARQPYKAFELFSEIKYWDLEPNVVTYTALIDACSKAGWPERAEMVLRKMKECGVEPNEITYGALVDAWARHGKLDRAFELLERMAADDGVTPNAVLLGGLVDACRRLKDGTHMTDLWRIVITYNIRPSRVYYPSMISLAAYDGDIDTAIAIAAHGYARGLFRRSSCFSEDPTLRSLAYAILCLRQVIRHLDHPEQAAAMEARIRPILDSMLLDDSRMDSLSVAEVFDEANAVLDWARSTLLAEQTENSIAKGSITRSKALGRKFVVRKSALDSEIARKAKDEAMGRYLQ